MHNFIPTLKDDRNRIHYAFHHQSTVSTSHSRTVRSLAFNPTGATLATASFDSTVGIWQQANEAGVDDGAVGGEGEWEALDPLEGHESECKSVEWSFDGRLIASCSRDKSVWIWEGNAVLYDHWRGRSWIDTFYSRRTGGIRMSSSIDGTYARRQGGRMAPV